LDLLALQSNLLTNIFEPFFSSPLQTSPTGSSFEKCLQFRAKCDQREINEIAETVKRLSKVLGTFSPDCHFLMQKVRIFSIISLQQDENCAFLEDNLADLEEL
jgi:hypothetical protein